MHFAVKYVNGSLSEVSLLVLLFSPRDSLLPFVIRWSCTGSLSPADPLRVRPSFWAGHAAGFDLAHVEHQFAVMVYDVSNGLPGDESCDLGPAVGGLAVELCQGVLESLVLLRRPTPSLTTADFAGNEPVRAVGRTRRRLVLPRKNIHQSACRWPGETPKIRNWSRKSKVKSLRPKDVFLDGGSEVGDELIAGRSPASSQFSCYPTREAKKKKYNKNQTREGKGKEERRSGYRERGSEERRDLSSAAFFLLMQVRIQRERAINRLLIFKHRHLH